MCISKYPEYPLFVFHLLKKTLCVTGAIAALSALYIIAVFSNLILTAAILQKSQREIIQNSNHPLDLLKP